MVLRSRTNRGLEEGQEPSISPDGTQSKPSNRRERGQHSGRAPRSKDVPLPLEFITITERPDSAKGAYSHVVRSQAMQAFLRAKREDSAPNAAKPERTKSPEVPSAPEKSFSKFKLSTWSRKTRKPKWIPASEESDARGLARVALVPHASSSMIRTSSPPAHISDPIYASLHPYGTLPLPITEETELLLHHYNTSYTINSFALNPEGSWISFSFMDPALLHATLGIVALHRDILAGNEQSAESLSHKGQSIHAINGRLRSGEQPLNDENLGVVALLIKFETLHGTSDASKAHMQGLIEMLSMRGGLSCLAHNPVLLRVLTWVDLLYATRWGCKPCIVPAQPRQGPLAGILRDIASAFTLSLTQYISSPGMFDGHELIDFDILETLQQISIAKANASELTLAERQTASHAIYLVNHRLLMEVSDVHDSEAPGIDIHQAFWVAALLYLHLIVREIPRRARIHHPLVKKLQILINSQFPGRLIEGSVLQCAIWIVFLGAAASPPEENGNYFISLLVLISDHLGITEQGGLKKHLREVVWIDDICDRYLSIIWAEMEATASNNNQLPCATAETAMPTSNSLAFKLGDPVI